MVNGKWYLKAKFSQPFRELKRRDVFYAPRLILLCQIKLTAVIWFLARDNGR